MRRESPDVEPSEREDEPRSRRKDALQVLLEAREKLLSQMTEDVLSQKDVLLEGPGAEGISSFELEEIEDRYSARLNALNSLLENLEYRHPLIRHRVETVVTSLKSLKRDVNAALAKFETWDLVNMSVTAADREEVLVVLAFTADEYEE